MREELVRPDSYLISKENLDSTPRDILNPELEDTGRGEEQRVARVNGRPMVIPDTGEQFPTGHSTESGW